MTLQKQGQVPLCFVDKSHGTMYFDSEYIEETCMICGEYGCNKHQKELIELDKVALITQWMVWT